MVEEGWWRWWDGGGGGGGGKGDGGGTSGSGGGVTLYSTSYFYFLDHCLWPPFPMVGSYIAFFDDIIIMWSTHD